MSSNRENDPLPGLHRRLLEGDPLASEEAARLLLVPLAEETQRHYPKLDGQLVSDAVVDALLDYVEEPACADEGGDAGPWAFLKRAAWRNAANLSRGGKRRTEREQRWIGELDRSLVADDSALGRLIQGEEKAERDRRVRELMAMLSDDRDRAVLRLRLDGERDVEVFARALGITALPIAQQSRMVKQAKDRIDKVLKRGRRGSR